MSKTLFNAESLITRLNSISLSHATIRDLASFHLLTPNGEVWKERLRTRKKMNVVIGNFVVKDGISLDVLGHVKFCLGKYSSRGLHRNNALLLDIQSTDAPQHILERTS
ncbi:hypothetical protein Fot_21961 [Forsythia ovata]|uniref:Uncharacterized protein n=1 Tax=Forsythia ovata TaxID=205694 RepID=A0ABD1UWC6_9LAMI